jgi:hypothetical protein
MVSRIQGFDWFEPNCASGWWLNHQPVILLPSAIPPEVAWKPGGCWSFGCRSLLIWNLGVKAGGWYWWFIKASCLCVRTGWCKSRCVRLVSVNSDMNHLCSYSWCKSRCGCKTTSGFNQSRCQNWCTQSFIGVEFDFKSVCWYKTNRCRSMLGVKTSWDKSRGVTMFLSILKSSKHVGLHVETFSILAVGWVNECTAREGNRKRRRRNRRHL